MSDAINTFLERKKANSPFLELKDGDSAEVTAVKGFKNITKAGTKGEEKEVLRMVLDVKTSEGVREKFFDAGSKSFVEELVEKQVNVGSAFTITRTGTSLQTRYTLSNVKNPGTPASAAPTQAAAPAPSAPTAAPAPEVK